MIPKKHKDIRCLIMDKLSSQEIVNNNQDITQNYPYVEFGCVISI